MTQGSRKHAVVLSRAAAFFVFVFVLLTLISCKKTQVVCVGDDAGSATTVAQPVAIPLDLPRVGGGEMQTVVKISLTKNGDTLLNGKSVTEAELRSELTPMLEKSPELRAVINADGDVAHKHVIHLIDVLKQLGISKIAFGVSPLDPPPPTPMPSLRTGGH